MPHYQSRGSIPKKRFTRHPGPDGKMLYEHLLSTEQLIPEASLLYRLRSPSRVLRVEPLPSMTPATAGRPIGKSLLFRPDRLKSEGDFLEARVPALFADNQLVFSIARPTRPMERFYCNMFADELVLVVKGSGRLESGLGDIEYGELDMVHIPRGMVVRWVSDPVEHDLGIIESHSPIRPPKQFIKPNGQFDDRASYHERDLRTPVFKPPIDATGEFPVVLKTGTDVVCSWMDHHPFDVAGWDGCYYPFALNLRDYEPVTGRIFQLVDRYQVFTTGEAAFVAVTPRRLPDIPNAAPANPFHTSVVCDEIMFRFSGVTGETETASGTFTLTPRGVIHGPKPGFEDAPERTHINWWGLLMETRLTLQPTVEAMATNDESYARAVLDNQQTAKTLAQPETVGR